MSRPDFFDIHSHIYFPQFDEDREEVISRLEKENVFTISVGTDIVTSEQAVLLCEKSDNLFASIGIHPDDVGKEHFSPADFEKMVEHPKVVAIGECGLDYFRIKSDSYEEKSEQRKDFERQIEFAIKHNKPLMLHVRDAYNDALDILESYKREFGDRLRGNSHFFAGGLEEAKRFLDIGFSLSFTGVLTFAQSYDEVVRYAPLEFIMSETDAPFVSPVPWRGKRNEPVYVKEVVEQIAKIRDEDLKVVSQKLVDNALSLFCIKI